MHVINSKSVFTLPLLLWVMSGIQGLAQTPVATPPPSGAKTQEEQWNVLPLSGNDLHASAPLLGEQATFPAYTRDLIQVKWRTQDPIDLYIIRPVNVVRPPVVLLLYGYPTDTDRFRSDAYCQALVKHGFAAVGFVSALTGQRYHDRPMKEWFVSQLPEALGASVHDVQMILNYLGERKDLDMSRVGIYGQGSGGSIAVLAAAVDPRIRAIDVLDPWGDWPDWMAASLQIPSQERDLYLTHDFLKSVEPFDPVSRLPQLVDRPLRLQQTDFSKVTPEKARQSIREATPANSTKIEYRTLDEYKAAGGTDGRIFDWLQHELRVD
jgi:hypothetical protein